ncbi:type I-E CRISPR-associated protein Cas6/Cse3/CasE [Actinomadura sp. NBRC 104412]|uniref:type I-E CRISPR-associated protein Cas6/Cse3/CasE n=1 Tax=Actinomadura sp. NBRC 104412 TaxID=3032203 RepID=UPI0024A144D3|nr:type I-E CRISPR-associated protein Cas6/Cse3/CasE [Actinomadura sp. NBRC 104412]GLZ09192.1 type I-E CRISPR-associated protein Cas6/Cse3/CasE [Actinomadura sp. NBRC 104412]
MYLTRAFLNPRRAGAIHLLGSPQRMHAAVMAGFPPLLAPNDRVLWRVDAENSHKVSLYIVSPHRPDLTHLVEQAGWPHSDVPSWATKSYEPLLQRLKAGQRYAFRLTANPTYVVARHGQRGLRRPHVTAEQQTAWLLEQSAKRGFEVLPAATPHPLPTEQAHNLRLVDRHRIRFTRKAGGTVTLNRVTFQGLLEVTDEVALRATLIYGIGRARAYGCGLLTLARPNESPTRPEERNQDHHL